MADFVSNHLDHFLFVVLLISRIGDILTTYIATPTLKLEANPIVRKLRWPFALLTLLIAFVAYASTNVAATLAIVSLLVCASNASWMWIMRVMGEQEFYQLYLTLCRRASVTFSLLCCWLPSFFFFLVGVILFVLTDRTGRFAASGFIMFAFIKGYSETLFYLRVRRETFQKELQEKKAFLDQERKAFLDNL